MLLGSSYFFDDSKKPQIVDKEGAVEKALAELEEQIQVEMSQASIGFVSRQQGCIGDTEDTALIELLDSAGQEEYSAMRDQYVRMAEGYLIVFALNSRSSYNEAVAILEHTKRVRDQDSVPCVFVGNKCDLVGEREVTREEVVAFAESQSIPYFETSAKMGVNVQESIFELVRQCPGKSGKDFKLVVLGSGGVGKSAITIQFVQNHFIEEYDPTIEDSYRKQVVIPGLGKKKEENKKRWGKSKKETPKPTPQTQTQTQTQTAISSSSSSSPSSSTSSDTRNLVLEILDTVGDSCFSSLLYASIRSSDVIGLVYSVIDGNSLNGIKNLRESIIHELDNPNILFVVIANKIDLDKFNWSLTEEEGQQFAQSINVPFISVSAKTGVNIEDAFALLARQVLLKENQNEMKVALVGDGGVGKSSITIRYINNAFVEDYDPTIEDVYRKQVRISGLRVEPPKQPSLSSRIRNSISNILTPRKSSRQNSVSSSSRSNSVSSTVSSASTSTSFEQPKAKPATPAKPGPLIHTSTNIISVSFSVLVGNSGVLIDQTEKGNSCICSNCKSSLSPLHKISKENNNWECCFCSTINKFSDKNLNELQIISSLSIGKDFEHILPKMGTGSDSGILIFCIDISGSMGTAVDTPILQSEWQNLKASLSNPDSSDNQVSKTTTTKLTRLQCIKAAVDAHIQRLKKQSPTKRIALIIFDSKVNVLIPKSESVGTVNLDLTAVPSNIFDNYNNLIEFGKGLVTQEGRVISGVSDASDSLSAYVRELKTLDSTALGPALAVGFGMAKEFPGSEIVACTDGCANHGIGTTGGFYVDLGRDAASYGVTINVLGIEGSDVNLGSIGNAADATGGTVTIVNPLELVRQVRSISQDPVVATNVITRVYLPPQLEATSGGLLCAEIVPSKTQTQNMKVTQCISRSLGPVTINRDLTLGLQVIKDKKLPQSLPIQTEVEFTDIGGVRRKRVWTTILKVTDDNSKVSETADISTISLHTLHRASSMAIQGDSVGARKLLFTARKLLLQHSLSDNQQEEYGYFVSFSEDLDTALKNSGLSSDQKSKIFFATKSLNLSKLLCGERKKEVVERRKVAEALQEKVSGNLEANY